MSDATSKKDAKKSSDGLIKVAIVGSGMVGRSWAVLFSRTGKYRVQFYDIKESQLTAAIDDIKNAKLPLLAKFGMLDNNNSDENNQNKQQDEKENSKENCVKIDAIMANISTTTDLSIALTDATFIQTAVPENLDLKQKVFSQIESILNKINNNTCIISSSCSTMVPSKLTARMKNKENISRFIVCHPVNPPIAIPVVEIVPGPETSESTRNESKNIMLSIGMKPVLMSKERDGFVVNTLQYGLLQAAYQLYSEGVASAQDIDLAISHGLGARWSFMGPFETIHLNAPQGVKDYCQRYAHTCIAPVVSQQDNNVKWEPNVWNKIHNEMIGTIPVDKVKERCQWRNNRLMELAQLKNEQNKRDADSKKENEK